MEIRPVLPSDRLPMLDLFNSIKAFTHEETEVARELLGIYLDDSTQQDYLFFITEEADQSISSFICFGPTAMTLGTFDLYWMGTAPIYARQGRARKLVEFLMDYLKKNEGRLVRVETSSQASYQGTIKFYEKNQFVEAARIKDFYTAGDDLIIFTRRVGT